VEEHLSPDGSYHSPQGIKPIGEFLTRWGHLMSDDGRDCYGRLRCDTRRWLGIVHQDGALLVSLDGEDNSVLDAWRRAIQENQS
jgi:hypothetical protein